MYNYYKINYNNNIIIIEVCLDMTFHKLPNKRSQCGFCPSNVLHFLVMLYYY